MKQSVIHSDPDVQDGVPVFVGTRVPVKNLFDYLEAGDLLDEFLESLPSVTRQQAVAALELAREVLAADARLDGPADADVERAWSEEAQRRHREVVQGKVQPISGESVFANLRSRLKR